LNRGGCRGTQGIGHEKDTCELIEIIQR
jgi:hypothetical protein